MWRRRQDIQEKEKGLSMEGIEQLTIPEHGKETGHTDTFTTESPGIIEKISYSAGGMGAGFIWITAASFLPIYCTDVAGIPAGTIGIIMLISRLFDSVFDLYMGAVIGRTKTRWGKARPWMLWSAIPMALCLLLLFRIPDTGSFSKALYLLVIYLLMEAVCFTVFGLPYNTMLSLETVNSYERNVMNTLRFELIFFTQLLISIVTMPLIRHLGGGQDAWTAVTGGYAVLCVLLVLTAFKGTKERRPSEPRAESGGGFTRIRPLSTLRMLCSNKYSRLLTAVTVVTYASLGMSAGSRIYYAKYVLGDENLNSAMVIFGLVPVLLMLFFIPGISKRIGKVKVLFTGGVLYGIGLMIMTAVPQSISAIYAGLILQGVGQAGLFSCLFAVAGDVADYCRWKQGISESALIYSMTGFGQKTGTSIGLALLGISLSLGKYSAETAADSAAALFSIKALYLYLPLALTMIVLFLWYLFMDFDKIYASVQKEFGGGTASKQSTDAVEKRKIM